MNSIVILVKELIQKGVELANSIVISVEKLILSAYFTSLVKLADFLSTQIFADLIVYYSIKESVQIAEQYPSGRLSPR